MALRPRVGRPKAPEPPPRPQPLVGPVVKIKKAVYDAYRNKQVDVGCYDEYDEDGEYIGSEGARMQWCMLGEEDGVITTVIELEDDGGGCTTSASVPSAVLAKAYVSLAKHGMKFAGLMPLYSQADGRTSDQVKKELIGLHNDLTYYIQNWDSYTHWAPIVHLYGHEFAGRCLEPGKNNPLYEVSKIEVVP